MQFARHSVTAILIAVVLEELGIPMPIPTDLLIVFLGATAARTPARMALLFGIILLASCVGASGLYALVRRGGRPLVDRFGRYVHLGPEQLARAQGQLERRGWWAIAVGRAIPGLRYVTVIACGLLDVPYLRFLTAHIVGSAVYIASFLALGATFGPRVIDRVHLPHAALRLVWLAALAIGLPLVSAWSVRRAQQQPAERPPRRTPVSVDVAASAVGTMALAAMWALLASISQLTGLPAPLTALWLFGEQHLGRAARGFGGVVAGYLVLLLVCWLIGILDDFIRTRRPHPRDHTVPFRVGVLTLLGTAVVAALAGLLLVARPGPQPWNPVQFGLGLSWLLLGMLSYATTTVCAETLAALALTARGRADAPDPPTGRPAPGGTAPSGDPAL